MTRAMSRTSSRIRPPRFPASQIASLVASFRAWPLGSQQVARRNAMIASTVLAQRRAEREDVEEFFSSLAMPAAPPAGAANG